MKTRNFYESRMKEFEIRCFRSALMNYRIAAGYDKMSLIIESASYGFGAAGAGVIGLGPFISKLKNKSAVLGSTLLAVGGLMNIISQSSMEMMSTLRSRAKAHNTAAGKWQALEELMKTARWRLQDPNTPIEEHIKLFDDLAKQRIAAVNLADIPRKIYEEYENPKFVKERKDRRQKLFDELKDSFSFPERCKTLFHGVF